MSSARTIGKKPDSSFIMIRLVLAHPKEVTLTAVVGIAVGILGWGSAFFLQAVLDRSSDLDLLVLWGLGFAVVVVIRAGLTVFRRILQMALVRRIEEDLTRKYLQQVLRLEMAEYDRKSAGELFGRLQGLEHLRQALEDRVLGVVFDVGLVVVAALILTRYGATFVALAVLGALLPAIVVGFLRGSIQRSFEETQRRNAIVTSDCMDVFQGVRDLRVAGGESWAQAHLGEGYRNAQSGRFHHLCKLSIIGTTTGLLSSLLGILILVLGAREVHSGRITNGQLMFLYTMSGTMLGPLENLIVSWIFFNDAAVALRRSEEILCLPAEPRQDSGIHFEIQGNLRLEGVGFEYVPGRPVLERISLAIESGSSLAIVGESGSGKSTLLSIISGIYRPSSGRVLVDGHDLKDIPSDLWRTQIGVVFQNPHLFEGTVRENVCIGLPKEIPSDLDQALNAAVASGIVKSLPDGLSTVIRRSGSTLSAGQVQRIAIARALVRNPKVLLLDEATSNLDVESEEAIWTALREASCPRTMIFVTHRLATSLFADYVAILHCGKIVEYGKPMDLLGRPGPYRNLWHRQAPVQVPLPEEGQAVLRASPDGS